MPPRAQSYPRSAARARTTRRWNATLPDRDEQVRAKREALLSMAVRLFNERGYHETSLADIAKHLNVTKPALYYYISGKEEILLECQRRGTALFDEAIRATRAHPGAGLERFRDFIGHYVAIVTTEFASCLIRSGPDALGAHGRTEIMRGRRKLERTLEGILEQGIADGSIAPCDTRMSAFAIFGALHWLCFWYREGGSLTAAEIGERMIALFTRGLEPRAAFRASGSSGAAERPDHG
jgi:AcrR family transcriptional regulator